MNSMSMPRDVISFNTLLNACARGQQPDKAQHWLLNPPLGVEPNARSFNIVINACSRAGNTATAHQLLEDMRLTRIKPDVVSFSGVAAEQARCGDWCAVEGTFTEMVASRVELDSRAAVLLLSAYAKAKPPRPDLVKRAFHKLSSKLQRDTD